MSAIIIPRRHYTQPQGRVRLSPDAQDKLAFAFEASQGLINLVDGSPLRIDIDSPPVFDAAPYGVAVGRGASAVKLVAPIEVSRSNVSISILGRGVGGAGWYVRAVDVYGGFYGTGHGTGPTFRPTVKIAGVETFRGYGSGANDHTLMTNTYDGTTVQEYYQGDQSNLPSTPTVGGDFDKMHSNVELWLHGASAQCGIALVHKYAISREEYRELYINPWQLFRADPIRIYSLPSGPITLGTPIISNITASGFRVSVGLT
ncbi:MAG: hypothetical protein RBT67_02775 [Thauera sp.]|nr:hypothetical protein [Thauera sp.]